MTIPTFEPAIRQRQGSTLRHWLKFNAVGVAGLAVQLLALWFFRSVMALGTLLATFLAVEAAIIHNFAWHELWTWSDRTKGNSGITARFVRFNMANGAISIAGNLVLMWLLVSRLGLHYLAGNFIAVIVCSIVNFFVSDRLAFDTKPAQRVSCRKEGAASGANSPRSRTTSL